MNKNYSKWFLSKVINAIKKYKLIENEETVAVALSGGKDSTALLYILWLINNFSHLKFNLLGIHIDLGFKNTNIDELKKFCTEKNIPLIIEKTQIAEAIMPDGNIIKNPCSLCSRLKRGALTNLAEKYNFKKIALGHHSNDIVETLLLNVIKGGRLKVFPPRIDYTDKGLSIIRPLIYIEEKTLESLCKIENLPIIPSPCPVDKKTYREKMKKLVYEIKKSYPDFIPKTIHALENFKPDDLW